jgi:hypothetical protein
LPNNSLKFSDFTRDWYSDVGSTITVALIISIFSPHAIELIILSPLRGFIRKSCLKSIKSDRIIRWFKTPKFNVPKSLSQILTLVSACFMFGSGIPLLYPICFVALLLQYWCNKVLLLKIHKKPPAYSAELNRYSIVPFPAILVLHSVIAIYVYSSPSIFPTSYSIDPATKIPVANSSSFMERLQKNTSIPYLVFIALYLPLLKYTHYVSRKYDTCPYIWKKLEKAPCMKMICSRMENDSTFGLLWSYDIKENPKYSELLWNAKSINNEFSFSFDENNYECDQRDPHNSVNN